MLKKLLTFILFINTSFLYSSDNLTGDYFVNIETANIRLAPNKNGKKTNILYKNQKLKVYEILNGWARISPYYSGKVEGISHSVARWVYNKSLSKKKEKISPLKMNSAIAKSIKNSDNYTKYKNILIPASEKLVKQGQCKISDFKDMGGWMRSSTKKNTYFTYCGGMSISNRIYLNIKTGKVSK